MTPATIAWNRFGLGPRRNASPPKNPQAWLKSQIDRFDPSPDPISSRPNSAEAVAKAARYRAERQRLRQAQETGTEAAKTAAQNSALERRDSYFQDCWARMKVAVESDAPFMERMVHFWANHFAVSAQKNQVRALVAPHEFGAIRPNVTGNFGDLLKASALHPAMLVYLDQIRSVGPGSPRGIRSRGNRGLNENLAREILELHTLGVGGGYKQTDVTELARALTGWTVPLRSSDRATHAYRDGAIFAGRIHEPGTRTVMQRRYNQSGPDQAIAVLDDLAKHPSTARHIATKLARHFAGDQPPQALVDRLATSFIKTGGDLPAIYRTLIDSPELWERRPLKFRRPHEWFIAALRLTGAETPSPRIIRGAMVQLGQPTWTPSSPAGWGDRQADWAAPDALYRRLELASRMAVNMDIPDPIGLLREHFPRGLNDSTVTAINGAANPRDAVALMLVSPELLQR